MHQVHHNGIINIHEQDRSKPFHILHFSLRTLATAASCSGRRETGTVFWGSEHCRTGKGSEATRCTGTLGQPVVHYEKSMQVSMFGNTG